MTPEQYADIAKQLGVAAPLVIVLLYLLRFMAHLLSEATTERKAVTAQFVDAMKTTASTSALAQEKAAGALQDLAAAMREQGQRSTDEHNRIVDALGKVHSRERS